MVAYCFRREDRPALWVCADGWETTPIRWTANSGEVRDHIVHWLPARGKWECWHYLDGGKHCRYETLSADAPSIMPWDAPVEAIVKEVAGIRVMAKALVPFTVNDDCDLSHRS